MHLRYASALLAACAATALAGCEPNQLYMASHTVIGVNGAVNPQQTSGWMVVGYDRTFATVIPRSAKNTDDASNPDPNAKDAMSALACSRLIVNGIMIQRFQESVATGKAAEIFANNLHSSPDGGTDPNVTPTVTVAPTTTAAPTVTVAQTAPAAEKKKALKDFFACFKDS